ncbi:S-adenosyl-L-methionine-dependent methyltransferase [Trichoderma afarasin]
MSAATKETLAEINAKHFDKVSPGDWQQWVRGLHGQVVEFLISPEFPAWLGLPSQGTCRMLDYACGDGVISKGLKQHFSSVVGVDVSGSMLDKYRKTAADLGCSTDEMVGVRGDLLADNVQPTDPPLPEEMLHNFDLVVISMALHHFENPERALQRLAVRLKVDGVLMVIDWTPLDLSTPAQCRYEEELRERGESLESVMERVKGHSARHTVSRPDGFTEADMKGLFKQAGCGEVRWKLAEQLSPVPVAGAKGQLFWARAQKLA